MEKLNNNLKNHIYPITATTQNQKKNLETKKFQPILQDTKLAERNLKRLFAY